MPGLVRDIGRISRRDEGLTLTTACSQVKLTQWRDAVEGTRMRDRLVEAVMDRLRRHVDTGDTGVILSQDALLEVHELLASGTGFDLVASYAAGSLHWLRYKALPPGGGGEDLAATLRLFAAVEAAAPRFIPDPDQRPKTPEPIRLILECRDDE